MLNMLHGLKDIHTVLSNHRKIGGAVEADLIRLSTGDIHLNPVFTNIDVSKGLYVSLSFIDENGMNVMIHVDEIAVIKGLQHKLICQLKNPYVRELLLQDTLQYLKKLCEINDGFVTHTFQKEALVLVQDISVSELKKHGVSLPFPVEEKLIHLNHRLFA